ncbi:hypothetical protein M758_4G154400 [Ceratodon purpureus]|nr:hypothetical protein M758_4G154400 [Ceratodon purpureus]
MNLPGGSYVSRSGRSSRSWSNSTDKVPLHVARNCGHKNPSPEIKIEDMASVYSDAGETFASRPSNAASIPAYEDGQDAVSAGLYTNTQRRSDSDSRDFILKRFLPAAQAMAATGVNSSALTSSENRPQKKSSDVSNARLGSSASGSSKSKKRFDNLEIKQDIRGEGLDHDEGEEIKACGFPLHLGRLTLQHFRYSFWTSRSSSRSKPAHHSTTKVSPKKIQEEPSDDSDDLFWSDEEGFDDAGSHAEMSGAGGMNHRGETSMSSEAVRKRLAAEMLVRPTRLHSMETVHTPDHRGFLGLPKSTKLTSGEMEQARQVDRLGARLTRMISKTNYMESRNGSARMFEHDETDQAGSSSQGPSTTTSSSSVEAPRTKWVDAVSSLMPPPSPKMPSESWLSNTLPPERFMEVKKLSRKSLGSYIPIKPPLKPMSTERQQPNREGVSTIRLRQSCSLKEHLQGRQVLRSASMQEV